MGFVKIGRVESFGQATLDGDRFARFAAADRAALGHLRKAAPSYYLDGAVSLDVRAALKEASTKYAISADPADYVYEAIRACTTNAPNDNHDGFHRDEKLRFIPQLRMAVYQTFSGKPHHVDHRTENPKAARGVILDAAYNDESPALVTCPTAGCETRTAERRNRDGSGLHCKRCGALVKDEFTEILVGVDGRKDAFFADNVRNGTLNKGSMGCNCGNTSCNVCRHVAYSKSEFCSHIRGSSKGTYWLRHEGAAGKDPWVKVSFDEAKRLAAQRGFGIVEPDFCYINLEPGDMGSAFGASRRHGAIPERERRQAFEVRKAFEYCADVVYDEYSRVPTPADPKALQREILRAAAAHSPGMRRAAARLPDADELRRESELLVREAQRYEEPAMSRAASTTRTADAGGFERDDGDGGGGGRRFVVVRVDGNDLDTYVGSSLEEALGLAMPDPGAAVEYAEVEAQDAGAARNGLESAAWAPVPEEMLQGMDAEGVIVVPDGKPDVTIQQGPGEGAPGEGVPGQPGAELGADLPGGPAAPGGDPGAPGAPGDMPPGGAGPGIGPYTDQQIDQPGSVGPGTGMGAQRPMTAPEVGILPPGVRARRQPFTGAASMNAPSHPQSPAPARGVVAARGPFAAAYSAWAVDVSDAGSARLSSPDGTPVAVFPARANVARTAANHVKVGQQIMASLLEVGLLRTITGLGGVISPRIAGIVDGAENDMKSYKDHEQYGSILEGEEGVYADARGTPPTSVLDEHTHDMQRGLGKPSKSVTESAEADHEINRTPPTSVTDQDSSTMRDKRKPPNLSRDSVLDGETHDHRVPLTSRSGARFAHVEHGGEFVVIGSYKDGGQNHTILRGAFRGRQVENRIVDQSQLRASWAALDGPLPGTVPVGAPRGRTADLEKCGECGKTMVAGKCAACDGKDKGEGKDAGVRTAGAAAPGDDHAKRWASAQVRKAKDEAAATTAAAVEAAVGVFARAVRVAARRQFVDLEESPLRQAALAVLGQPHVVGTDAATGQALAVDPPDPQVARHLVASILADGYQADIERVLARAAALSEKGEPFLVEAEKDLENIRPSMPEVVAMATPPAGYDGTGHRAAAMRDEASRGFTRVSRGRPPLVDPENDSYRGRIANVVNGMNGTRTGHLLARLAPPNGVPQ